MNQGPPEHKASHPPHAASHESAQRGRSRDAPSLPGFSLLADPDTIAGRAEQAASTPAHPGPAPRLDLEGAARLAADAKQRMNTSRAALDQARREFAQTQPHANLDRRSTAERGTHVHTSPSTATPRAGWARRSLVSEVELGPTSETRANPNNPNGLVAELKTALEIAHDTAQQQRDELNTLHTAVRVAAERERELAANLDRQQTEVRALRGRLTDSDTRLSLCESENDTLRTEVEEAQSAYSTACQELDAERNQNAAQQSLLDGLRRALADDDSLSELRSAAGISLGQEPHTDSTPYGPALPTVHQTPDLTPVDLAPRAPAPSMPPIFDAWLDDQVRRHFGPMGFDCLADMVAASLDPSEGHDTTPSVIVLVGEDTSKLAGSLANGLIQSCDRPFQLVVFDPAYRGDRRDPLFDSDHPLSEFVEIGPPAPTPDAFSQALAALEPDVLVGRHFLSSASDPADWIEVLAESRAAGCDVFLAERSGAATLSIPGDVAALGEQIWDLMPERYKARSSDCGAPSSWAAEFESRVRCENPEILSRVRERFDIDLFAQFGFLAEPFVAGDIGLNFSADESRDRRFLAQVTDLDDQRIESGSIPALHWIARISDRDTDADD